MMTSTLQQQKNRYVVRSWTPDARVDVKVNVKALHRELDALRTKVSEKWQGPHDAVKEIREQRGGAL